MIDVTNQIISMYDSFEADMKSHGSLEDFVPIAHPQASLMFSKLAAHHSHGIAKTPPGFHDFDHAVNFQALAVCLSRYVDHTVPPSFEEPLRPNPQVKKLFQTQLMDTLNIHQAACIRNGLWRIFYDSEKDRFHACLTRRRRLSALLAISWRAHLELLDDVTGGLLTSGKRSDDDVYFAFASSAEHLRILMESTSQSWEAFTAAAGFSADELTAYAGFLVFLGFAAEEVGHSLCYGQDLLLKLRKIYSEAFSCDVLSDEVLMRLMDLFSLSPDAAAEYSLPVPFFCIGERYLRYHDFERIMSPAMGLLTIAIRKHEFAWSRTLGSTLAHAADSLAASLPDVERVEVAVRRGVKGKGDVDLALYDIVSGHLLVCEVKTVYDKHRTVHQMHRFEEAKVNISRAIGQIRRSIEAIASGDLNMISIFGRPLPQPARVHAVLLTWLDPIDLTMGTSNEDIYSLNFATFRYLFSRSAGDVSAMMRSVAELRNIWCVAKRRPLDLGQPELNSDLEAQIPILDADEDISSLSLSSITEAEIRLFSSLPSHWQTLPDYSGSTVSYLNDTRREISR